MGRIPLSPDEFLHPERYAQQWRRQARMRFLGVGICAAVLLVLAVLMISCPAHAEEPFVSHPSRTARALIYGLPVAGDAATTLWARSRGAVELHPALQDPAVMVAFKVWQAAVFVWLDGKLPPFWRWVLRGAVIAWSGWQTYKNYEIGKLSLSLSP